ncbi:MAG: oligosaccharide flippase family protein [Streptococcaceae bacterium]|jgi:PST family polysaccharide transporter|nr:oligosaccharide flippase family protein [Streptococcaceae bacterium]
MARQFNAENVLKGVSVLTVASFIAKILSALYRVPYQNYVGDIGFYVYQQVYPIYGVAMMIALGGLPQFISKVTVESQTDLELESDLYDCFRAVSIVSFALFLIVFFGSDVLANMMGQAKLSPVIKMSALSFLITPFLSIIRGAFQGKLKMIPTATSQLLEQILRVIMIWFAAWGFQKLNYSVYETGELAMSGSVVGGVAGVFLLLGYLRKEKDIPIHFHFKRRNRSGKGRRLLKRMVIEGGVMSIYSGYLILLQLVDSFTINKALVDHGLTGVQAEITKGIFDRGQPFVQLGLIVSLALTSSFLPSLTEKYLSKDETEFKKHAKRLLKLTIVMGAGATAGLIALLPVFNIALFKENREMMALSVFVTSAFFMVIIQAIQSIFQSQGDYWTPLRAAFIGIVLKVLSTSIFTETFGITGTSFATILALCGCLLSIVWKAPKHLIDWRTLIRVGLGIFAMSLLLVGFRIWMGDVQERVMAFLLSLLCVLIGGTVYMFILLKLQVFSEEELEEIPWIGKWKKRSKR